MGCGTSKEGVVSSDGSGRCSRKLFRRKSSIVATGAHQPVAANKNNGDAAKHQHHKAASAPAKAVEKGRGKDGAPVPHVEVGGDEVASTVIAAKVVGEKEAAEQIEKDQAVIAGDAKEKETASGVERKLDESVSDKEVVADRIKDDVASATGSVVILQEEEEEEGTENGEPVEVSIVADERDEEEEGASWAGANEEAGWSSEKDIEEIAAVVEEEEDDSTVAFADARPVGVPTVEDVGVVAPGTVAGDDGSVAVVAAPEAKEDDELVSFVSAPLAAEVDGLILPTAPVADEAADVTAPFTAGPVAKPNESSASVDGPMGKEDSSVTVAGPPPEATVDAAASTTANEEKSVMYMAAPASTEDEGAPAVDAAALPLTTTNEDETVASPVAPVTNVDESLALPAAAPVSDVEAAEAEQPAPSGNDDDDWRNDQGLPEPAVDEEPAKKAEDVATIEEINVEQEEVGSVVPAEPEEEAATSPAASREDDGESDEKQATDLNDAANTDQAIQGEEQLPVEEKKDGDEKPTVPPIESSTS